MKKLISISSVSILLILLALFNNPIKINAQQLSPETQECIDCHESITPGIVGDWNMSLHSKSSLILAKAKPELTQRISINDVDNIVNKDYVIGCYECHSQRSENHKDNFEHFGFKINIIVSPEDCKTCHPLEVNQYHETKKYNAIDNLTKNPIYSTLVETIIGVKDIQENQIKTIPSSHITKGETCFACHGDEIKVEGLKIVESVLGEIEVPNLMNWPNHGVGRINPDGSKGVCTSCHPRHSFSIEVARKPYTCGQCHLEPDVPAYNVYKESKHGNIFDSKKEDWNFNNVPWIVGEDFNTPTCATCHNSLVTTSDGEIISERTHDFGKKLWTRIFGLIYSHPQSKSGRTYEIINSDNLPLPTTFDGKIAEEFLIDRNTQIERKELMASSCKACHSSNFTYSQLAKIEFTNAETDKMVKTATSLVSKAWEMELENNSNPFDEQIEIHWQLQWLFYANSIRYVTAMMGPDYSTFKNGWWEMNHNLQKMKDLILKKRNKK